MTINIQPSKNTAPIIMQAQGINLYYGNIHALKEINLSIREKKIVALIGPSGCGKTTFLRTLNRMNDLIPGVRISGEVSFGGLNVYGEDCDVVELRKRVGMAFFTYPFKTD